MAKTILAHFSPSKVIFLSVFFTIMAGALLLSLPIARTKPIAFIDLVFTAASATCVTGLFAVPMSSFTTVGHAIILGLVQIGGLGLVTLTLFAMYLLANLGLATQLMAGQLLEIQVWRKAKQFIFFIIAMTICSELIGTLLLFTSFKNLEQKPYAWFLSSFYSISSFCSAGMPILPNNMQDYAGNYTILVTCTFLMFLGGLGFFTLFELKDYIVSFFSRKRFNFSLFSKINLTATFVTITITASLVWMLEHNNSFAQMNPILKIVSTFFHAISFRSTGWASVPIANLQLATVFLMMITTFIGASPGSTGSGIKMTALTLYLATIKSAIFGHTAVNIKGREIPQDQIFKVIAIVSISVLWILLATFCLLITEPLWHAFQMLFEVVSAFATLGISIGNTETLSYTGKLFIILTMIIGRIGSLTLILALKSLAIKKTKQSVGVSYPEERVMLS